jgi:Tfp pilus assembly pilus retraction ATPase PilT
MSYSLSDLMQLLVAERGEAIHLHDREPPVLEIRRELHRIEGPPLERGEAQMLLQGIATHDQLQEALRGCTVFEHHWHGSAHFQVMAFREGGSIRLELRRVIG